jgi:hypothetical protein
MANKKYYGHPANDKYTGVFEVYESRSTANNTNKITWYFKLFRNDNYSSSYSRKNGNHVTLKIDGATVYTTTNCGTVTAPNGEVNAYTLATNSFTLDHNADGTKSFEFEVKYTNDDSTSVGPLTVKGTHTCTSIPRASTITVPEFTLGKAGTITINRASTKFTHKLTYKFGTKSGTISSSAGASASWTPARSLGSEIPNALTGTGTITCTTYDADGNSLGSNSMNITLNIDKTDSNMIPTFESLTGTQAGNSVAKGWGVYVRGKSKCSLTIAGESAKNGATIKAYSISGGGYSSSKSSLTTGYLDAGDITFTAKVKDSRGIWSAEKTFSVSVVDYSAPKFSSVSTYRCNESKTKSDDGKYFRAYAKLTYSSCSSKNSITCVVNYRKAGTTAWTKAGNLTSATSALFGGGNISTDSSYDVQYVLSDAFTTVYHETFVSSAFYTMHFKKGGKGVAVGKVSESDDLFDVGMKARFRKQASFDTPIDVSSGGTGATDAATARANLGLRTVSMTTTNISSSNPTYEFDMSNYRFLLLIGRPGESSSRCTMLIPKGAIGSDNTKWQITDNNYYVSFNLKIADGKVTITYADSNGDGFIDSVRVFN